jgi:predicted  nucleic acid-binding Zn-ribbon protein
MATKTEVTVEEKLRALFDLQLVDSKVDEIRRMRGELPLEVEDLEDEIAGLNVRLQKLNTDLETLEHNIKERKNLIEDAKVLIKKYNEQQKNVRNNREFNSITKEIEYQELEIQLAEKHIREYNAQSVLKKEQIAELSETLEARSQHLHHKKSELDAIMADTEKEEEALRNLSKKFEEVIEDRLLMAYKRIRTNVRNGLAIVSIDRGASGGSYFTIPPQVQMEIASRKKIITDEHSGRILIDPELAAEETAKVEELISGVLK